jgi:ABC-type Fe3+/spermidine/putrescine transport system ATPase subunit
VAEVYRKPASPEVARLLGLDNICSGVAADDGAVLAGSVSVRVATPLPIGAAVFWSVPPERIRVTRLDGETPGHPAIVSDVIDLGTTVRVTVRLNGGPELRSRSRDPVVATEGEGCLVHLDPDAIIVWT